MIKKFILCLALVFTAGSSSLAAPWDDPPPSYSYVDGNGYVYNCHVIRWQMTETGGKWVWKCTKQGGTIVTGTENNF